MALTKHLEGLPTIYVLCNVLCNTGIISFSIVEENSLIQSPEHETHL